jgi:hypothetical protein
MPRVGFVPATCTTADCKLVTGVMFTSGKFTETKHVGYFRDTTRRGNPAGLCVGAVPTGSKGVAVFVHLAGVDRVEWLPVLVLPMSNRLEEVMRVGGQQARFPWTPERTTGTADADPTDSGAAPSRIPACRRGSVPAAKLHALARVTSEYQ